MNTQNTRKFKIRMSETLLKQKYQRQKLKGRLPLKGVKILVFFYAIIIIFTIRSTHAPSWLPGYQVHTSIQVGGGNNRNVPFLTEQAFFKEFPESQIQPFCLHYINQILGYMATPSCKCGWVILSLLGFPGGSGSEESVCNAGELGLIPGLEDPPGEGNGYPHQYSYLKNSMDSGTR